VPETLSHYTPARAISTGNVTSGTVLTAAHSHTLALAKRGVHAGQSIGLGGSAAKRYGLGVWVLFLFGR
jgi:hypothetical protein